MKLSKTRLRETLDALQLSEEKAYLRFFDETFNIKLINTLVANLGAEAPSGAWTHSLKGYSLPIYKGFGRDVYDICQEATTNLGFSMKEVEYYVSNEAEFNCGAVLGDDAGTPHAVIINRGLLERVSPGELKFVLGHELGHLIYGHSNLTNAVRVIYPEDETMPALVQKSYEVWSNLAELSADRIGLLASRSLEDSVWGLFKLSSGLQRDYFNLGFKKLLNIVNRTFAEMKRRPAYTGYSHPANPVRIKALLAFVESGLWKAATEGRPPRTDRKLEARMNDVVSIIRKQPYGEAEYTELMFLAAAGMTLVMADKDLSDEEYTYLLNVLSRYIQWPQDFLGSISKGQIPHLLKKNAGIIVRRYPWRKRELLQTLFAIVVRDGKIRDEEVSRFFTLGDALKVSSTEAMTIFLEGVRELYKPLG